MSEEQIKLTKFSHGGGCGCKIAPQILDEILQSSASMHGSYDKLIVGNNTKDDAAVYQLNDTDALISTTDFFTPIVNDPYIFGKVAAANAISDVYAMGGTPIFALAILGWPINKLPTAIANQVMEGAKTICQEANIPLAGGHSIDTLEPVFGLAVNGLAKINQLKQNSKAQPGDLLLLTKPLGIGILSTAAKREVIEETDLTTFHELITQLNKIGAQLGEIDGVHAMTDVTGFGLAGHLIEMCEGSNLSAILHYQSLPKIKGIENYLKNNVIPDATYRNWNAYSEKIKINNSSIALEAFQLLPDPQTNGGLLIAVTPESLSEVQELLKNNGYASRVQPIGVLIDSDEKMLYIE
ncbi:MAG: selenide, water dikinase SelD [Crocinitomicaceae bacterium]|nr:selenide, water dikinase SelD [Crocinitomicaceae bacterium]